MLYTINYIRLWLKGKQKLYRAILQYLSMWGGGGGTNHAITLKIWQNYASRLKIFEYFTFHVYLHGLITVYCQGLLGVSYIPACWRTYCAICMCSFIVGFCCLVIWQFLIAARLWLISPIVLRFECCWLYIMSGRYRSLWAYEYTRRACVSSSIIISLQVFLSVRIYYVRYGFVIIRYSWMFLRNLYPELSVLTLSPISVNA